VERGGRGLDGPEYARIRQARQSEVVRAQRASAEESARDSAEIGRELKASEERRRIHASEQADAAREFEIEASFRPQKVESTARLVGLRDGRAGGGEKVAEGLMSVLGELTGPIGKMRARVYTVAKETVKGTSEGVAAYIRGKGVTLRTTERLGHRRARRIGFGKGVTKVGFDEIAGWAMNGVARLAGRRTPQMPDLRGASVASVVRDTVSGAGRAPRARAVGISVSQTWASDKITPVD